MSYDYIIIGLGAAGCVVAARLTEKNYKVLCLEAGNDYTSNKYVTTPFSELLLWGHPSYKPPYDGNYDEWLFKSAPQKNNTRYVIPRGVELGGSASHNAMITLRGDKYSYDQWANITGDNSWNYENMLYYFKKLENNHIEGTEDKWHGRDGWFKLSQPDPELVQLDLIEAVREKDIPYVKDFNGDPDKIAGVGLFNASIYDGIRTNSAINLLLPILHQKEHQTEIKYNSLVTRLIVKDKKIIGVEYETAPFTYEADTQYTKSKAIKQIAYVSKEVILCAGAINTPQILMLSGIGPKEHLEENNIKVEHILNGVGKNLEDHINVTLIHEIVIPYSYNLLGPETCQKLYDIGHIGPYTSNGCAVGYDWFANSQNENSNSSSPDFHVSSFITYFKNFDLAEWADKVDPNKYYHTTLIERTHPYARGTIKLKSNDPHDSPIISENLDNPMDIDIVTKAFLLSRDIWKSKKMHKYEPKEVYPGPDTSSENDIKDFIASKCAYGHHLSGTAKMGKISDTDAVVDSTLKVIGLSGLRIVDASVFPIITSVNPTLPIYAVAEKAANMIIMDNISEQIPLTYLY